jgi:urate oxidase
MTLSANRYGKARVRIMRVDRASPIHNVSELSVTCMLHGDFDASYTSADNRKVVATDSIKNIINITAREYVAVSPESYCAALAETFLHRYAQVERVTVQSRETRWQRLLVDGVPQPHSFVLDPNGAPTVDLDQTRTAITLRSGIDHYTFMKSTQAGWTDYVTDEFTTLAETTDRIVATSMNATWLWQAPPAAPQATNAAILTAMITEFATTYSQGVQDSLFRMGNAALQAAPDIAEIAIACPNKHYLPIDLAPFGLAADKMVFTPTDEPHGQIECTLRR